MLIKTKAEQDFWTAAYLTAAALRVRDAANAADAAVEDLRKRMPETLPETWFDVPGEPIE